MGAPESSTPHAPDPATESRTCRKCDATKQAIPTQWPHRKNRTGFYVPHGGICLACEKARKAEYEKRRDEIALNLGSPEPSAPSGKPEDQRKALKDASKLDVARALKAGSQVLNTVAPSVLARIMEYLEDPEHEHHMWALDLLASRVLPKKLYEDLGAEAAGVGGLADKRPMFVLNVNTAMPEGHQPRVVEGEVTDLKVLPSPQQ